MDTAKALRNAANDLDIILEHVSAAVERLEDKNTGITIEGMDLSAWMKNLQDYVSGSAKQARAAITG